MALKMSKQAILELLDSNEAKYRKTQSRKAKGVLLAQLMELTGYKSSKNIIRFYAKKRKPPLPEKRGRMAKLHPQDIQILKLLWLKSNQPCGAKGYTPCSLRGCIPFQNDTKLTNRRWGVFWTYHRHCLPVSAARNALYDSQYQYR